MGIRCLNKFLLQKCKKGIQKINLLELSNKHIAVDISIYMYRFKSEGNLIEGIFQLNILFDKYNITPIYVFDTKNPGIKINTINARKNNRLNAIKEYDTLVEKTKYNKHDDKDFQRLNKLKRDIVQISREDILNVKKLFDLQNKIYINATGEADYLCAKLVKENYAYACMSEDTDLFAYGCPCVLRYFSIINESLVKYDYCEILNELNINDDEFKTLCIVSTNDYNTSNYNIWMIMNYVEKYNNRDVDNLIYNLINNTDIDIDIKTFYKLYNIFNLNDITIDHNLFTKNNMSKNLDKKELYTFLSNHNFVIVE